MTASEPNALRRFPFGFVCVDGGGGCASVPGVMEDVDVPIPEFLAELRSVVGHRLLWLPGVHAVVVDDAGRLLLNKRADTGRWSVLSGILDPGEQPAAGAVREVFEETGVHIAVERLASVDVSPVVVYANGDRAQYLDVTFKCRRVGGDARVNDSESLAVGWFHRDELPALGERNLAIIEQALDRETTAFVG